MNSYLVSNNPLLTLVSPLPALLLLLCGSVITSEVIALLYVILAHLWAVQANFPEISREGSPCPS